MKKEKKITDFVNAIAVAVEETQPDEGEFFASMSAVLCVRAQHIGVSKEDFLDAIAKTWNGSKEYLYCIDKASQTLN